MQRIQLAAATTALVVATAVFGPGAADAQNTVISTPFHNVQDNFYERIGVGFGFFLRGGDPNGSGTRVVGLGPTGIPQRNIVFGQNSFNNAVPTGGGFQPNQDANLGFGILGDRGGAFFNFAAGQGSNRTLTTQVPMVNVPNGGVGTFSDSIQVPFVTSVIPVVGRFAAPAPGFGVSPIRERYRRFQQAQRRQSALGPAPLVAPPRQAPAAVRPIASAPVSTAARGDLSVAEIRRQQRAEQAEQLAEIEGLLIRAEGAEALGKPGVAKIYYRMASREAQGDLLREIQQRMRALEVQSP